MKVTQMIVVLAGILITTHSEAQEIHSNEVKDIMEKVADWQIEHYRDLYSDYQEPHHPLDWTNAAFYLGLVKWAALAQDDKYYNWLFEIGKRYNWRLHDRIYVADDHAVGQLYVELYRKFNEEQIIEPSKERLNYIVLHPAKTSLKWNAPYHLDRWNWCDALFMSPPLWAKLYNITGERKYLDFMMAEFRATTDFLYDQKESLFYRDEKYIGKMDRGVKIFWSRGNGWVFAGLVNIMNELSPKSKEYKYFLRIYKRMAEKLIAIQTPEGHWSMSLLGQKFYPTPETSGSSFFIYGLAWGINKGILKRETYAPAVKKGWIAMVGHVSKEGMLGYVQPIGAEPGNAWEDKTEVYGTGAFLSAGSEVYQMLK